MSANVLHIPTQPECLLQKAHQMVVLGGDYNSWANSSTFLCVFHVASEAVWMEYQLHFEKHSSLTDAALDDVM